MDNRTSTLSGRLTLAWRVLCGGGEPPPSVPVICGGDAADLRGRIAGLEQDLVERDKLIALLKQEMETVRRQSGTEQKQTADDAIEVLARKLVPLFSQIDTVRAMHEEGKELRSGDLLKLCVKLQQPFTELGLAPIGRAGEVADFDSAFHQRMSGGDCGPGNRVRVRFVGYKFREKTLIKAMVSKEGGDNGDRT